MTKSTDFERIAVNLIGQIFAEFCVFETVEQTVDPHQSDVTVRNLDSGREFHFEIKSQKRITPQIADDIFERISQRQVEPNVTVLFFAPTISERVAEIAKKHNVSYLDQAGNCLIKNNQVGLYILRTGNKPSKNQSVSAITDVFSPKSSRIVRAMLSAPDRNWKTTELAEHPDVQVSLGLVSKVRRALIQQNYATKKDGQLVLSNPIELLEAWSKKYRGANNERHFYVRGEVQEIENQITTWLEKYTHQYALARFSAAWAMQPSVRYNVASMYVDQKALTTKAIMSLRDDCGAREVESGANLVLLTPYDISVFAGASGNPKRTSELQTWLDLKQMKGRGEEAATEIYEHRLKKMLAQATDESE